MSASAITAGSENFYVDSSVKKAEEKEAAKAAGTSYVSHDEFLNLLVTQLTHQDPLEPMKDLDMTAQLAQLQALDEQVTMTQTMNQMRSDSQLQGSSALIGKHISGEDEKGAPANGVVNKAVQRDGKIFLELDNLQRVPFENVEDVVAGSDVPDILDASNLVNMYAYGKDLYGNNIEGIVESASVNGTRLEVQLANGYSLRVENIEKVRDLTLDEFNAAL